MTIRCHYDGKVIVPDEPVELPLNKPLTMTVTSAAALIDPPNGKPATVSEILKSGVIGAWKDREDISDSLEFARSLRRRAEQRGVST